ncbi:MAG: hypothetical protein AABX30_02340 [Nanoarchaeota archaeon]
MDHKRIAHEFAILCAENSRYSTGIFMHPENPNKPHTLVCGKTKIFS